MSKPFHFKQFSVEQDQCAMKVGTDGVLLGAWAQLNNSHIAVLDIGTGTGLIALMSAQRNPKANITAIEIDNKAANQAKQNVANSKWNNRIHVVNSSLQNFKPNCFFDVIISNPPYFQNGFKSKVPSRDIARHTDSLNYKTLLNRTSELLLKRGCAFFVIPYTETDSFVLIANQFKLLPTRICYVKGSANTKFKRTLIEFSFKKTDTIYDELIIEKERHVYTQEYIDLTKDFYLKM